MPFIFCILWHDFCILNKNKNKKTIGGLLWNLKISQAKLTKVYLY